MMMHKQQSFALWAYYHSRTRSSVASVHCAYIWSLRWLLWYCRAQLVWCSEWARPWVFTLHRERKRVGGGVRENDTKRRGFIILSSKLLLVRVTAAFLPVAAPVWSWWCTWRRVASSLERWRRQTGPRPPRWDGRHPSSSSLCPPHSWTAEQANTLLKDLTRCALSLLIELAHTMMFPVLKMRFKLVLSSPWYPKQCILTRLPALPKQD